MSLYKTLFEKQENKLKTGIVGITIITMMLAVVFHIEASAPNIKNLDDLTADIGLGGGGKSFVEQVVNGEANDYTQENDHTDVTFDIGKDKPRLKWVNCSLSWQDEDSQYLSGTNEPDNFKVSIIGPQEEVLAESEESASGPVTASIKLDYEKEEDFEEKFLGTWTIRVSAGDCGDDSARVPLLGLRTTTDDGNAWSLEYSYTYLVEKEDEEKK